MKEELPTGILESTIQPSQYLQTLTKHSTPEDIHAALSKLAVALNKSDGSESELCRFAVLNRLKKLGFSSIKGIVDAHLPPARKEKQRTEESTNSILFEEIDPWDEPVIGTMLLTDLEESINNYVVLPDNSIEAAVLWVVHAHAHKSATISPLLVLSSPEKRCGKTTLLLVLSALVPRPLPTSNITAAALFRTVEKYCPTLLVDEADTFVRHNEGLRGILNAGYTRGGFAIRAGRTSNDDFEARAFSTWAPKVIALIGKLPSTLEDRSIIIPMRRRTSGEAVQRLRLDRLEEFSPQCRKTARWASDHADQLRDADPCIPNELHDRASDNWRPLLAIADAVGGEWPERARKAALTLSGNKAVEDDSIGTKLLSDIRSAFQETQSDRMSTEEAISRLKKIEERPWAGSIHEEPISPRRLASLLQPFGIRPRSIRIGGSTPKGYRLNDFQDAFARYLPPDPQPPQHHSKHTSSTSELSATGQSDVAESKYVKSCYFNNVADVATGIDEPNEGKVT